VAAGPVVGRAVAVDRQQQGRAQAVGQLGALAQAEVGVLLPGQGDPDPGLLLEEAAHTRRDLAGELLLEDSSAGAGALVAAAVARIEHHQGRGRREGPRRGPGGRRRGARGAGQGGRRTARQAADQGEEEHGCEPV